MKQQSKVEREILADVEEDQATKSQRREFRERLQERADRRKRRQEEKEVAEKESLARKEERRKNTETRGLRVPRRSHSVQLRHIIYALL